MSRLVPYRTKAPDAVKLRIEQTLATTMYLVQTTGPTSYVVQEQNCDKRHKVLIGSLQSCSCGDADVCIHVLFVLLKVLRVPATTPIVWQKSLIDSEVDMLLRGGYREQSRPAPKAFMKRQKNAAVRPETEAHDADVERHELVEGEVCAICQEDMDASQPLTFCKKGCGNNFHIECMKVFGESRKQTKDNIICPLCRHDWGDSALTTLKKEIDVANQAPNVHKSVACKKCQTKPIRNERYRCIQCKNVDLCARCFKANAHIKHTFVMKKNVSDTWIPAIRGDQRRSAISADLISDLEGRELSTNDYDLLLQLDQAEKYPLQDFLLSVLGGEKIAAENARAFGGASGQCMLCSQTLRMLAALRVLPCGHSFHESCVSRSILAMRYLCPDPSCECVLFPGLHYLSTKSAPKDSEGKLAPSEKAVRDPLIAVFGLHPTSTSAPSTAPQRRLKPIQTAPKRSVSTSSGSQRNQREEAVLPDLLTFKPFGRSSASTGGGNNAPTLPGIDPSHGTTNQNGHATNSKPKKKAASVVRGGALPPIGMSSNMPCGLSGGSDLSLDDRLSHAKKARAELRQLDKERRRKQREGREEKSRRAIENNQQSVDAPATASVGGIHRSGSPLDGFTPQPLQSDAARVQLKTRKPTIKPIEHAQYTPQQNDLNDLFIGHR